jgi:hypothetical protein
VKHLKKFHQLESLMRQMLPVLVCAMALALLSADAMATTILIGTLSYDTFIPGNAASPGINAFDISNLTGSFDLPPDFPVSDILAFQSATLTVTFSDLSQEVFALGTVNSGFLLDASGNPVIQVPGNQTFASAEFTAALSLPTFALADGTIVDASSTSIDAVLLPSAGATLVADTDQTTIGVSAVPATTPEPASLDLVLLAGVFLALHLRRISSSASFWTSSRCSVIKLIDS